MSLMDYDAYLEKCKAARVEPLPPGGDLEMVQQMSALGPHVIPYLSTTGSGTIWVHNTRHKTHRRDRPFLLANMETLKEKSQKTVEDL